MAEKNNRKKLIIAALKFAVTVGVIWFTIHKLGWNQIVSAARKADPQWLIGAFALFIVSGALGVFQWRILLRNRGISIKYSRAFALYFIGMFFNNFILGTIAGDAIRIAYLRAGNGRGKEGFAATFLDRFAGLWAMTGFALAGSIVMLFQGRFSQKGMVITAISLIITFSSFSGILALLVSKNLQNLLFWIIDRLPFAQKTIIADTIRRTLIETHDLHIMFSVGLISGVVQFMRIGVHIFCAAALGFLTIHNVLYFFIFVPIIAIMMIVPLPFGVKEAAEGMMFALCGFEPESALVLGFLASIIGIGASFLGGLFFIAEHFKRSEKPV